MRTNEGVADCLPAWDGWTGSDPGRGWDGVHIPNLAVPYQAPRRDGSLPASA